MMRGGKVAWWRPPQWQSCVGALRAGGRRGARGLWAGWAGAGAGAGWAVVGRRAQQAVWLLVLVRWGLGAWVDARRLCLAPH